MCVLVCQAGRSDVGDLVSVVLLHVELGLGRLVAIDEMLPVLSKYRLLYVCHTPIVRA